MKPKKAKKLLCEVVQDLTDCKQLFSNQPKKDFTRNRKLPFDQIIKAILSMGGGSISNEMMDLFGFREDLATTSAFVQQRAKIRPEAFEKLFDLFVRNTSERSTYRGLQLLAVDGSDFLTASNPDDPDSFFPVTVEQKSYNLLHLNALYDLTRHVYVDALLHLLADRGYESYNVLAHLQEKGWKFLIRVKDGTGGVASGLDLPNTTTFDLPITLSLTRKQSNEVKQLLKDRNHYKLVPHTSRFDFLPERSRKHDPNVFYPLSFRIVRFPITENTFETVITNLDADDFPPGELKKLYAMRRGIEPSFRELKYTVGLQHFHAKKVEFVHQEIFARLTMYNFYEFITQSVVIQQKDRKYAYKVNFSAAVHICRQFFLRDLPPPRVEALLAKHISPIRPGRSRPRKLKTKQPFGFLYRVA